MLLARETACLSRADRAEVDRRVAGDPDVLEAMGDGEIVARAREVAYELDPVSFVERRRRAEADRRVSLRPAPDVMSQLSTLLPVKDGVAVWAVLSRKADQLRAAGDPRSRGQIMADTLVHRVLNPGEGDRSVPLMINVVVPDSVLLGDDDVIRVGGALRPGPRRSAPGVDRCERRAGRRPVCTTPLRQPQDRRTGLHGLEVASIRGCAGRLPPAARPDVAALSGATPRCDISTTPSPTPTAVRPARPTGKDSANTATTPKRPPVGQPGHGPDHGTPSRP